MTLLDNLLPKGGPKRTWAAIGTTVAIAWLMTLFIIYVMEDYGLALFVLVPIFIGTCSAILYGHRREIEKKNALLVGLAALGIYAAGLLAFAIEGVICLIMAAPIGIILTLIGSIIGSALVKKVPLGAPPSMLILIGIIPLTALVERGAQPALTSVITSIEINAGPETVWKNVVAFPQLNEPEELIFKAGIAYPINATIEGTGVGSIRYCNFSTGSFVEPITVWDEPHLLRFDVADQPEPMKELSFWDIDAPHLHDYFVSKQGQFKLTELPNGNTLLEGTTWYYHRIKPAFYWRLWSDYIIHKIHGRVLTHIKENAEAS